MGDEGRRDVKGPTRPWRPEGRAGARPARDHWLTGHDAELLLTGRRVHPADAETAETAARLARLLAAARGHAEGSPVSSGATPHLDPAREEAALTAFRAAHGSVAGRPAEVRTGRARGGPRSARRAIRMAVAAAASVIALSGVAVAVAATTGRLPLPGQGAGDAVSATGRPPTALAPDPGTATHAPAGPAGSPVTTAPAPPAPGSRAWCEAYQLAHGHGGVTGKHCDVVLRAHDGTGAAQGSGQGSDRSDRSGGPSEDRSVRPTKKAEPSATAPHGPATPSGGHPPTPSAVPAPPTAPGHSTPHPAKHPHPPYAHHPPHPAQQSAVRFTRRDTAPRPRSLGCLARVGAHRIPRGEGAFARVGAQRYQGRWGHLPALAGGGTARPARTGPHVVTGPKGQFGPSRTTGRWMAGRAVPRARDGARPAPPGRVPGCRRVGMAWLRHAR